MRHFEGSALLTILSYTSAAVSDVEKEHRDE
jgi:hypothetical protein